LLSPSRGKSLAFGAGNDPIFTGYGHRLNLDSVCLRRRAVTLMKRILEARFSEVLAVLKQIVKVA
jgi:hypothetical protein